MELGTDIIEISRIQKIITNNPKIVNTLLSEKELVMYNSYLDKRKVEFLAGRFCAKEAYVKALGTGFRTNLKPVDIEILPNSLGVPIVVKGPVIETVKLSISHSDTVAMATCLIDLNLSEIKQLLMKKGISL